MVDEDAEESNSSSPQDSSTLPYFIPRRPRVIRMRDLSPATRENITREYFDAYDPWTGIRIAATLGLLISLFALFLAYKSRFHHRNGAKAAARNAANKTSLYLYDDDDLSLSSASSGGGMELPGFHLEEVYVKSSNSVVAALKVKRSSRSSAGKVSTMRIMEGVDASRSLPCSPLKDGNDGSVEPEQSQKGACCSGEESIVDRDRRMQIEACPSDGTGSDLKKKPEGRTQDCGSSVEGIKKHVERCLAIEEVEHHRWKQERGTPEEGPITYLDRRKHGRRSLGAVEESDVCRHKQGRRSQEGDVQIVDYSDSTRGRSHDGTESGSIASVEEGPHRHECKKKHGRRSLESPSVVVVVAKKPQDYRSRSTVVSIARRQRLAS